MTALIFLALLLGVGGGLILPQFAPFVKPIGDLFLLALKSIVSPLIFVSVTIGAASLKPKELGRVGFKALFYFIRSMSLAVCLGLAMVQLIRPGEGVQLGEDLSIVPTVSVTAGGFLQGLLQKLFQNPFQALAEINVLGIVVFGILLGISIALLGETAEPVKRFFEAMTQVMLKVTHIILYLAPPGIFALVYFAVAEGGSDLLMGLGKYIVTVVVALSIHAAITLPLLAFIFGGRSIRDLYRGARPAMAVAFGTASSAATIPVTYRCATETLKIPRSIASFVIPIGATVNMNGTALYEAVAVVFIAQAYGIELQGLQLLLVFLTSLLAAVGAAAIPSAGLVTMVLVLNAVGLPLEGIGLVLGVDRFLDMCRTSVNVLDDIVGCVVVAGRTPAS